MITDAVMAVIWNDIDLYQAYRDFTTDNGAFPPDEVRAFIQNLVRFHLDFVAVNDEPIGTADGQPSALYVQVNTSVPD